MEDSAPPTCPRAGWLKAATKKGARPFRERETFRWTRVGARNQIFTPVELECSIASDFVCDPLGTFTSKSVPRAIRGNDF